MDANRLAQAVGNLDDVQVISILKQIVSEGSAEAEKAMEACQQGMNIVGDRFELGEYFVADLVFAGEIMKQSVELLKDVNVVGESGGKKTKMILCTVKDDLHDIGKDIVKTGLELAGFEIIDMGVDVAPESIIEEIKNTGVRILGLSGVLTLAIDSMKATVEALEAAGLRDDVKVIIGGAPTNERNCQMVGADAWALSPRLSVRICKDWADGL